MERIIVMHERRRQDRELLIDLERNSMALFANAHRDHKTTAPFTGHDFYPLSFDEVVEQSVTTGLEMFNAMSERFKNKPLKSRRNGRNSTR
jgi:hypothetical protein